MISTVVMFHSTEQNRETINSTLKVAVSFKIIMTTSVTRSCFTTQHQTCKTKTKTKTTAYKIKTKTDFLWSQTGLVLRPTVSDHITGDCFKSSHRTLHVLVAVYYVILCYSFMNEYMMMMMMSDRKFKRKR